ncbi:MAG: tryptophan halogenase family protein [Pseudomonadota bacterium]|nr:tryptophan halogenase family protein [Pseudomonadota bacterium]
MSADCDILIVGGGTAGWMTAAYLARILGGHTGENIRITLIESSEIGIIGVGEGTIPTIRATMNTIGVDEAVFMREANASFKQGIKFVNWTHAPETKADDWFYHSFSQPRALENGQSLTPYWLMGLAGGARFSDATCLQDALCEKFRAPKTIEHAPYLAPMSYAYHFDAGKLAALLKRLGVQRGVRHLLGNVEKVELGEDGAIDHIKTREHGDLRARLYIDSTGFAGVLIEQALGEKFRSLNDVLFVDRAVAIQVPYASENEPVKVATTSTAHEAGWTWDIPLMDRRGVGYVYSSRYTDDERAEEVLRAYIGPAAEGLTARRLKLRVGERKRNWVKNCVAVGLSAGFLEPLESTGIMMSEVAAHLISLLYTPEGDMSAAASHFNRSMGERFRAVTDFIKLHYCLTKRTDAPFWIDNARAETIPDSLQERLALWRHRPPDAFDFPSLHECFEAFNYQYILYGMEFDTQVPPALHPHRDAALREFERVKTAARQAMARLPDHRALLRDVYARGFTSGGVLAAAEKQIAALRGN